jgi:hypothetical protein
MGFKHLELTGFAAYLMRPVEVTMRRVTPRPVAVAATTLKAGAIVPASSGQAIKITTSTVVQPQPAAQGCGVKFNPESLADPARLQGFVCLLLTQDGQGTTLPDGTKLFRRNGAIEHWKGDVVVESSGGMVTRDAAGRYWFLEFQGWL